ncbi:MAG: TatD family hydrolase [Clostridia bacterium]|nr:TatD family hydrolase [Clostridia bacterium]
MMRPLFDSHAHYHDSHFYDPALGIGRDELLSRLFAEEICGVVNVGTDLDDSRAAAELAERFEPMYAAAGIYPSSCPLRDDSSSVRETLEKLETLLKHPKIIAIGEIGLDFHYDTVPKPVQRIWFEAQLELAERVGLPVIIHSRDAHGLTAEILKNHPGVRGVLHSYSGSAETAAELTRFGWFFSFSGVVTFQNAKKLASVVPTIPDDRLLIETDAPYLTPVPFRGRINHSGYLRYTAEQIAQLRHTDPDTVADLTRRNAEALFGISVKTS